MLPKHRLITGLTAVGVLATLACAHAAENRGLYMARYLGIKVPETMSYISAPSFEKAAPAMARGSMAGALGFRLSPHWRVEGELTYRADDLSRTSFGAGETSPVDSRMQSAMGLANIYYDFDTHTPLKPFIGVGAGYVTQFTPGAAEDGGFTWQAGAGLSYSASPSLSFESAYRFLDSPTSAYESAVGGHEVHVGVKYALPVKPRVPPRDTD